jgi:hypothetical protein
LRDQDNLVKNIGIRPVLDDQEADSSVGNLENPHIECIEGAIGCGSLLIPRPGWSLSPDHAASTHAWVIRSACRSKTVSWTADRSLDACTQVPHLDIALSELPRVLTTDDGVVAGTIANNTRPDELDQLLGTSPDDGYTSSSENDRAILLDHFEHVDQTECPFTLVFPRPPCAAPLRRRAPNVAGISPPKCQLVKASSGAVAASTCLSLSGRTNGPSRRKGRLRCETLAAVLRSFAGGR